MNSKKLKDKVQEYFGAFSTPEQEAIFHFVFKRLKRMAEKNNLQGQKISKLREAVAENGETYNAFLLEKNLKIEELSKYLYEEKTNHANDITSLRSSMKSQTETIVALRGENEKLRGVKDEAYIKRVGLTQKILDKDKDNDQLRNENERFKKVIAHSADRIVELEMQNKNLKEDTSTLNMIRKDNEALRSMLKARIINHSEHNPEDMVNKAFGIEKEIQMKKEYGAGTANDKLNQIREILK